MKRTNSSKPIVIPDAINCCSEKDFTQIPNDLIRNPNISAKAKAIICLLLSNKEGWHSCLETILSMMQEKRDAVQFALKELERFGYLQRLRLRKITTKVWIGTFWIYTDTPFNFQYNFQLNILASHGLEAIEPQTGKPASGKPAPEKPSLKIYNNNNTNNKKYIITREKENFSNKKEQNIIPPSIELVKKYCSKRNNNIDPITFINFYTSKGWMIGKNKMVDWHSAIHTWERTRKSNNQKQNNWGSRIENNDVKYRDSDEIIN